MLLGLVLSIWFLIIILTTTLFIIYNKKQIFIADLILILLAIIFIFSVKMQPVEYTEDIVRICKLSKIQEIDESVNQYAIIVNSQEPKLICFDLDSGQFELPLNKCRILHTQGGSSYIMEVLITTKKWIFKFGLPEVEYRVYLPEQNIYKILYIENQL